MTSKAWLEGFTRIPGVQDYGDIRRPDLPLALLRHTWEGIYHTALAHIRYTAQHMTHERPHFVVANPHTTALAYEKAYAGSKKRMSDAEIRDGYELLGQAQPLDGPSFSLRGAYVERVPATFRAGGKVVRVETNHANVWQTEFVGWAADTNNLTDDELNWEARKLWLRLCLAGDIAEMKPYKNVGDSRDRLPGRLSMNPNWREEHNFVGHQHMPFNTHWDPGPYPYHEVAQEVNRLLAQARKEHKQ